jgi:hypothetical protein
VASGDAPSNDGRPVSGAGGERASSDRGVVSWCRSVAGQESDTSARNVLE